MEMSTYMFPFLASFQLSYDHHNGIGVEATERIKIAFISRTGTIHIMFYMTLVLRC